MSNKRPVQISEFADTISRVSDEDLKDIEKKIVTTIDRLNESILLMFAEIGVIISNYKKTNSGFKSETSELEDDDDVTKEYKSDLTLYKESIQENMIVLKNNYQRRHCLLEEFEKRGLKSEISPSSMENLAVKNKISEDTVEAAKKEYPEVFEMTSW